MWTEAIAAMQKREAIGVRDAYSWFYLAMADWQLGHKDKARQSYDRAVEWMKKNCPQNVSTEKLTKITFASAESMTVKELLRLHNEVAELLNLEKSDR